jgi:tetratricopeptide (TPR) repeat protein
MGRFINLACAAAAMLAPAAAKAEWHASETAHFIIYSESKEADVAKLAERLESIDGLMRMASHISEKTEPVKVKIYEVTSTGDVEKALGLSDSGVAGFYDSNILGPYAVTPRTTTFHSATFSPELVLHHEYAHHFMLQYFPAIYPSWYVEGFAELIGSSKIMPDGRIGYGMPAKHRGNEIAAYWVPLNELFLKPAHKIHNLDLYAQGWALTHYFTFSKSRSGQLRAYLNALSSGKPPEEAVKVFGDLMALNREARRYVTDGSFEYKPVKVEIARPVIQRTYAISAGEAALIPQVIAFRDDDLSIYRKPADREHEQKLREANLQRIREKAARFPNDPFALHLLAQTEYGAGNYPASEAAADRLLAVQPNHVRAMVIKSLNLARAAGALSGPARTQKAEQARRFALRANQADPDDALPLLAFYQSYHLSGETPSKEAVTALRQVVQTLPADTKSRQLLVDEFARQQKWALAINTLQPIANSPHESPMREAAREQMEKLQAALAKAQPAASTAPAPATS